MMITVLDGVDEELMLKVVKELSDPLFLGRTHGKISCYNEGCRGPFCRKVNRDRSRQMYGNKVNVKRHRQRRQHEEDEALTLLATRIGLTSYSASAIKVA